MTTWAKRVKSRMKELGLTQEELANKMGITRGAITHYLAERRVPPLKQFEKLAVLLKVDPAWLQFGSISDETPKKPNIKQTSSLTHNKIPILSWEKIAEYVDTKKIPKNESDEFVPDYYTEMSHWFALRVKGDSMTSLSGHSKCFHEGDILIIDPDKTAKHGDFVIILLPKSKEATFKQYVIDGGVKYLKPLNPQYPTMLIDKNTFIYGTVVASIQFL